MNIHVVCINFITSLEINYWKFIVRLFPKVKLLFDTRNQIWLWAKVNVSLVLCCRPNVGASGLFMILQVWRNHCNLDSSTQIKTRLNKINLNEVIWFYGQYLRVLFIKWSLPIADTYRTTQKCLLSTAVFCKEIF